MKDDKGEMIIEASIVFPLVLIIYGILMFLVLLMYQRITLTTVANNTVSCVSANYGFSDKDPFMSFINKEQLNNRSVLYREIFGTTDKLDLPIDNPFALTELSFSTGKSFLSATSLSRMVWLLFIE